MNDDKSISVDRQAYLKAKDAARKIMSENPTAANIAAFERAQKALDDYDQAGAAPDGQIIIKNRRAALKYLKDAGYKIGRTKLYDDAKNGLLKFQADGSIFESDLQRYIKRARLVKPVELSKNTPESELHLKLNKKKGVILDEKAKALVLKRKIAEGSYIETSYQALELASRGLALDAHLRLKWFLRHGEILDKLDRARDRRERSRILEDEFNLFLDQALTEFVDIENYHVIIPKDIERGDNDHTE